MNQLIEYVGNLHVHSDLSDGSLSIEEIAREAQIAGLDFVGFTDHRHLKGLKSNREGWHDKVLVLIGCEINVDYNHYLCFGIEEEIPSNDVNPQQIIDACKSQGGLGFIAHPFEKGTPHFEDGKSYPWTDWSVENFDGIEIWNITSLWRDHARSITRGLYYYMNRLPAIGWPEPEAIRKWDEWMQKRKVVAIAGSDAHAFPFHLKNFTFTLFPYRYLFKTVNMHILTKNSFTNNAANDRQIVYNALKSGHCFVSNGLLGRARGFRFWAKDKKREDIAQMGDELKFSPDITLWVNLPHKTEVIIKRNGETIFQCVANEAHIKVSERGCYRVEAYRKSFTGKRWPWIISNPIYLR